MVDLTSERQLARRRESSEMPANAARLERNDRGKKQANAKVRRRIANYLARPFGSLGTFVFSLATLGAIYFGWQNRNGGYLTAEEGLGYQLGIVGGCLMLIVLLYPLRKKLKIMRGLGSAPIWFRTHMVLGVLGPTLILFHANFKLGSLNSNIALISMLLVAMSGLVGRFIYKRIHMGLHGKKAQVQEILVDIAAFKQQIGADLADEHHIQQELRAYEQQILLPNKGIIRTLWFVLKLHFKTKKSRAVVLREVRQIVRAHAKTNGWSWRERRQRTKAAAQRLSQYFAAVRKASQYSIYERLFSLWHVLHLPLFYFLILSAIAHVIAVHLY